MKEKLSYRKLLEGGIKFNILFFVLAMLAIYRGMASFGGYYDVLGRQLFLIFSTLIFAKIHLNITTKTADRFAVNRESLCVGLVSTVIMLYLHGVYIVGLPFNIYLLLLIVLSLSLGTLYWFIIIALSKISFLDKLIAFLDIEFTYKDFIHLMMMLNTVFFVIMAVALLVVPDSDRDLFGSVFVVIYFEVAFFVLHFIVAKIVDIIWHKNNHIFGNVSMFGMVIGSICYVVKLNVIDQNLLHLFYFDATKSSTPLLAVVTLVLFWSFFALLFHFEVKYPLKGRSIRKKHKH